ncbi:MAG: serine hydrolase domain-containing protein [Bacteroidota bacterium]
MTFSLGAQAQINRETLQQQIDALFADADPMAPGSAIMVMENQEVIFNQGYGLANLTYDIPITPHTVFDMASVSKQFAGYAIAMLIDQGKVAKEGDIRKYIPELPDFGETITVGHLVHHTSGLRDWTTTLSLAGRSYEDVISFDHILRMAYNQQALNFQPGSQYRYSNTGYNLLAELVQRVTGETFRDWTQQHIFEPLEMSETVFLDNHREVIPNRAMGYSKNNEGTYQNTPNYLTAMGSSSLYSTTHDMAKWVRHLMYPTKTSQPVVRRMLQMDTLNNGDENNYAYGIAIYEFRGSDWIAHSGDWASFRTYVVLLPAYDLSVVVLNNNNQDAFDLTRKVVSFCVPEREERQETVEAQEDPLREVTLTKDLLDTYTGTYKLGTGWYVHLTREGNRLYTQATNEDKYPMQALSDSVLNVEDYGNRTMTFKSDGSGAISHLIYNGMVCPKMSDETEFRSTKNPEEYEGDYFSSELITWYKVVYQENQLYLWSFDHGAIPIEGVWKDDYLGSTLFTNNVEFVRNNDGVITGLSVSQYRAKNQFFSKVRMENLITAEMK